MTVLDTFYLLFKSNADEIVKGNKRAEKSTDDLGKSVKKTGEETEKLGKSFVKMVEAGAEAVTAVLSFGAIKAGVMNAQQLNSSLEVQGKLMGQNVGALRAYAAATEAAGGSQQGFLGFVQGTFQGLAAQGLQLPEIGRALEKIRGIIKQYPTQAGKELAFQRLGITDPGLKALLQQSDSEYARSIELGAKHAKITREDAEAARAFGKQWSETMQSLDQAFTHLGTDVFPSIIPSLKSFSEFLDSLRDHKGSTAAFFVASAAGASLLAGGITKLSASLIGLGGAGASAAALLNRGGILGLFASIPWVASAGGDAIGQWIKGGGGGSAGRWLKQKVGEWDGSADRAKEQQSLAFWISQGYTPQQAAGLVANEWRESGGNPNAVGDYGYARGIFQWHRDRQRKILAGTGIDVRNASHEDQLRAAAWELRDSGIADKLKATGSATEAAALISMQYERPANGGYEAATRASMAAGIASSYLNNVPSPSFGTSTSYGNKVTNIKIDDVNVHTQATDAGGIAQGVGSALKNEFRMAVSNWDDGVAF